MAFLRNLFGKKALMIADIIEPNKQDSMFPTYVIVKVVPTGLGISFDSKRAEKLDGLTEAAVIGEYHWLSSEYSTEPFVMPYSDIEKIACHFYEVRGNMTSYVSGTEEILKAADALGDELKIYFLYHNKAKGTKLKIGLQLIDANENIDNRATRKMYNAMILATSSH